MMHDLLRRLLPKLPGSPRLAQQHDGAILPMTEPGRLAFTTDSYVVDPLFFPGGDIGRLAINGTINDLAMCGAMPLALSCSLIIEEGFSLNKLDQVFNSIAAAAASASTRIVTGDTKVIGSCGSGGLFINTAGIGLVAPGYRVGPEQISVGDAIIVSGDLGRHAIAVMCARGGLEFDTPVLSDSVPLHQLVSLLIRGDVPVHCLRDATRGGLASTLVELAESSGLGIRITEEQLVVSDQVHHACELLGLDPLYLANEGCCIVMVPADYASKALALMHSRPEGQSAAIVGEVTKEPAGIVLLAGLYGTERVLPMLSGDPLPRIC